MSAIRSAYFVSYGGLETLEEVKNVMNIEESRKTFIYQNGDFF